MKRSHPDSPAHAEEPETPGYSQVGEPAKEEEQQRKRRRGMTEKRRRDRINDLLSQLQELIPSASERKDTGKLEKAELLEMAVMHMRNKVLLSKGPSATEQHGDADQTAAHRNSWTSPASMTAEDGDRSTGFDEFRQAGFFPINAPLGFEHTLASRPLPVYLSGPADEVMVRGVEQSCCLGCLCDRHHLL